MDNEKGKSEPNVILEDQGIYVQSDELDLGDDDIQTAPTPQIKHPIPPNGPHLIENDEPPNFLQTRRTRYEKLFAAVDISNNCPTARQAASRKYPLTFLCDFAGSVLDTDTGELLEYRHLIKHPRLKDEWKFSFGMKLTDSHKVCLDKT